MKKTTRHKSKIETWLNVKSVPIFLLAADRSVLFFNTGCEELTGYSAETLFGHVCDYASEAEPLSLESLTCSLAPPPEVLQGETVQVPVYLPERKGHSAARLIHFFPLLGQNAQVENILGIITALHHPTTTFAPTSAQRLHAELAALRLSLRHRFGVQSLVCRSLPMTRVLEQIRLAQQSQVSVCFLGESGTGREHVARLIHTASQTKNRAFVPLDCRQLVATQLTEMLKRLLDESRDESAGPAALWPGTVYLANVDQLARDLQGRFVEAFQDPQRRPVVETRLMASSSRNLREALCAEQIRSDFYHLITPLQIELPPLRQRMSDLPELAQAFLERHNRNAEKQVGGFSDGALEQFQQYNWPGNLDELMAVVEEAWTACSETLVRVTDLPFRFRTGVEAQAIGPPKRPQLKPLEPFLAAVEKEQIQLALTQSRDNKSKAAELLGITRARLYRRMQALGIQDHDNLGGP